MSNYFTIAPDVCPDAKMIDDMRTMANTIEKGLQNPLIAGFTMMGKALDSLRADIARETMILALILLGFSEVGDWFKQEGYGNPSGVFRQDSYTDDFWVYTYETSGGVTQTRGMVRVEDRDAAYALAEMFYRADLLDMTDDSFYMDCGLFTIFYVDGNGRTRVMSETLYYAMQDANEYAATQEEDRQILWS